MNALLEDFKQSVAFVAYQGDENKIIWCIRLIGLLITLRWIVSMANWLRVKLNAWTTPGALELKSKYGPGWAVVTGASQGIGESIARFLAERGFNIVLVARSEDKMKTLAKELEEEHGVGTEVVVMDFAKATRTDYNALVARLGSRHISFLVNNAGVMTEPYGHFIQTPSEDHDWLLKINFGAPILMLEAFLPKMESQGKGAVINMASASGLEPFPYFSVYGSSKAALITLTKALSKERRGGLTFYAPSPLFVATKMARVRKATGPIISAYDLASATFAYLGLEVASIPNWRHRLHMAYMLLFPSHMTGIMTGARKKQLKKLERGSDGKKNN